MTKLIKMTAALMLTVSLTGCGGFEFLALTGVATAIKTTTTTANVFGNMFGEALARGLGCALSAGLNLSGPRVTIEIEAVEFNFIAQEIATKKIVDARTFWAQLDTTEAESLRAAVLRGYYQKAEGSSLRTKPHDFYLELIAFGMISAARENVQVSDLTFARHILTKGNPNRYDSYLMGVRLRHAGTDEVKAYSTCE